MVAGGLLLKRFLKNVRRPGIAAVMPTVKGRASCIDVGANVNPKPEHLFQYGVMGSIFARHILQRPQPTIGLMNVGSEEQKGHDLAKDTHALFNASPLREPVRRQRRGPRHSHAAPPTSSSATASSATSSSRPARASSSSP